jgi:hypothetical protein
MSIIGKLCVRKTHKCVEQPRQLRLELHHPVAIERTTIDQSRAPFPTSTCSVILKGSRLDVDRVREYFALNRVKQRDKSWLQSFQKNMPKAPVSWDPVRLLYECPSTLCLGRSGVLSQNDPVEVQYQLICLPLFRLSTIAFEITSDIQDLDICAFWSCCISRCHSQLHSGPWNLKSKLVLEWFVEGGMDLSNQEYY